MREKYCEPEMEIVKFDTEDVITTSDFEVSGGEDDLGD